MKATSNVLSVGANVARASMNLASFILSVCNKVLISGKEFTKSESFLPTITVGCGLALTGAIIHYSSANILRL